MPGTSLAMWLVVQMSICHKIIETPHIKISGKF